MRSVSLSKAVLNELCLIMVKGNSLLKECAEMMGLTHNKFRGKLFNNKLDTSKLTPEQLAKLEAAKPFIFAVREKCELKILEGFNRMVLKQAQAAAANNFDPHNAIGDFRGEGVAACLDAIYSYSDMSIKFSNFLWQCIRRRIVEEINRRNPFCPLTNEAVMLLRCFNQQKDKFNDHVTDEQVVEAMGLSDKQKEVLFGTLMKVINEAPEEEGADDYTAGRRSVNRDFKEVFVIRREVRQAIKDAELNDFELECLVAEMYPYHGWKEDVASKHVNQKTGQRFTRQNIMYALERAKKKVKAALTNPPAVHKQNPNIDKFFDEMSGDFE